MTANSNTVPKLGFGCMRFPLTDPKDVTAIDIDQVKEMVDLFMDAGGTYFDTAFVYHDGHSEVALREALVERYPRDSFTIATKCLAWALAREPCRGRKGLPGHIPRAPWHRLRGLLSAAQCGRRAYEEVR